MAEGFDEFLPYGGGNGRHSDRLRSGGGGRGDL